MLPDSIPESLLLQAELIEFTVPDIEAADTDGKKKLPSFAMAAYSGGFMELGWGYPTVLNASGVRHAGKVPILIDHGYAAASKARSALGHATKITTKGGRIAAEGVVSGVGDEVEHCMAMARNGFPFQASVGVTVDRDAVQFIAEGQTVKANGQTFKGPCYYAASGQLREISIVVLGADPETETTIAARAAQSENAMKRTAQSGTTIDPAQNPGEPSPAETVIQAAAPATPAPAAADEPSDILASINKQVADNYRRIAKINELTADNLEIRAKATEENWSVEKTELEMLRASRPNIPGGPAVIMGTSSVGWDPTVIEASLRLAARPQDHKEIVAQYGDRTVDAAAKRVRSGGLSIQRLLIEAAQHNGCREFVNVTSGNVGRVIEAAFSSTALSNLLSNVSNKTAESAFMDVEQNWREFAKIKPVKDFKQTTGVRLTHGLKYQRVSQAGEVKYGSIGDKAYVNKADTHAILFTLTREDIINDDLGMLNEFMSMLGSGGAQALNELVWSTFLNNGTFFQAPNGNYFEGASTNLSLTSLETAVKLLAEQKDEKGIPINVRGSVLLVPPALEVIARQLFVSTEVRPLATAKEPVANVFANQYRPVMSPFIGAASGIAGGSSTAWYLLARSGSMSVLEVVFLDGRETPTIESVQLAPDRLGVGWVGYHDFGAALAEHRLGVKSKGIA